jgi:selenocysteine-specific elongation factor
MREVVVGTAGHIDHGKTALVEALTGINTDRLKEEKERGITIELGFAHLTLPSGLTAAIVDVPGHERFVRTMVAGAAGIDVVMLVVAADEGVMPQTREHLDICRLLGVKTGIVALTKIDLVDEEWLQLVEEEIGEFVKGTFLDGQPIVKTSCVTGQGLEDLVRELDRLCQQVEPRPQARFFRLPIDRVFTIRGFGTVVTGTLMEGTIREGDAVEVAPKAIVGKVRGLQVHNRPVRESTGGFRTAVNIQGVDKDQIERGDVLVPPGTFPSTYLLDVFLEYLPDAPRPMKNRARIRFHCGTSELLGRVVLLDREELEPGCSAYAQLRLEAPTVALHGDPYVIRSYSPIRTIGGGVILDPRPRKHRRYHGGTISYLREIHKGALEEVICSMVTAQGTKGLSRKEVDQRLNLPEKKWGDVLESRPFKERIAIINGGKSSPFSEDVLFVSREAMELLKGDIRAILEAFHETHPLEEGIPREELRGRCPRRPPPRVFERALEMLQVEGVVESAGDRWRLASYKVELSADVQKQLEELEVIFNRGGLKPPTVRELLQKVPMDERSLKELLDLMVRRGHLIKVKEDLYFPRSAIEELRERLIAFLKERGEISPLEFKEMTRVSRKFMIPLLEYFDRQRVTLRVGDKRVLRG